QIRVEVDLLPGLLLGHDLGGLGESPDQVPRRPRARVIQRRQARGMDAHQVSRRSAEALPKAPSRIALEARGLLFERGAVAPAALRGQGEEDVETVGPREADREEGVAETGIRRVLLQ